ncbi:unnamed protein product [Rodentolepis nana]|uniref:60S ribosomal export protein NMD3 n=1 Tax=Rodentolepis nana TaxID=102285 RepID=A0A0R3TDG9_RODNA|nr:unnamed protein product [Rodentolepis nana]
MFGATASLILCCKCGTSIRSNPTNMCEACLTSECNLTKDVETQYTIVFCPKCNRFLNPPSQWVPASLESPELLSICLKKVKGLGKSLQLKEASFVYTEPHSKRLIVQIVVRGEIYASTVVEQKAVLHYVMHPQQCLDCTRHEAKDYWNARVQVRQRVDMPRTLHMLEQLLLRKKAPRKYSNVKNVKGGIDFYFTIRSDAVAFTEYVGKLIPCRTHVSQQLKSHDVHNNTYNYKWTYLLEVVPVCKNDVVCLTKAFSSRLGMGSQVLLVDKITDKIRLCDPSTAATAYVDVQTYFSNPFQCISNPRNVTEFFVMDVDEDVYTGKSQGGASGAPPPGPPKVKGLWIVPSAHLGADGEDGDQMFVKSHLGYLLKIGDTAVGLDLRNANINNTEFDKIPEGKRPDVVLIKRYTDPAAKRCRKYRRRRRRVLSTGESVMETVTIATEDLETDDLSMADETETLVAVNEEEEDCESSDYSDEFLDAQEELVAEESMETE